MFRTHLPCVELRAGGLAGVAMGFASAVLVGPAADARPVICTTTVEAPATAADQSGRPTAPVEVTRCGAIETTGALVDRRAFTWRSPSDAGVDMLHQATDILGLAMGGLNGTRVMGFGFPDQAIVWDGTAINNTYTALLEEQSGPIPFRTADLPSEFTGSLQGGAPPDDTSRRPVRGLW